MAAQGDFTAELDGLVIRVAVPDLEPGDLLDGLDVGGEDLQG